MDLNKLEPVILNRLKKELSPKLHYHNVNHTISVIKSATTIAENENVDSDEMVIVKTAALLHDIGFLWNFNEHEAVGAKYVYELLPEYNYTEQQIDQISSMILATKVPQNPQSHLAEILCDADLAYLGSNYYHTISNLLFREFIEREVVSDEGEWHRLQISFLKSHRFHTQHAKEAFQAKKEFYLHELINEQPN